MKYFSTAFVTAVIVFLGATIYYKGLPSFVSPSGVSVTSTEVAITDAPSPSPAPVDETTSLTLAVKEALVAKYGSAAASLSVSVSKIEGNYAGGTVSEQGGGGGWFAAKTGTEWKLVWDGNGQIDCKNISGYPDFPKSMIPECWNSVSGKLITR